MKEKNATFHVKIKDFQSLSNADIKLENGLTILTGATNNGKSAIVRAIAAAIFNDGKDDYIRAGADSLSVMLDNGEHVVEYVRKRKGNTDKTTYRFDNGEVQQKVGRTQLPEMEKMFNIREVRLQNNQRTQLNFWYQNDWPFLMDATPGQLYEFLSVSSSEAYLEVLKKMNDDIKNEDTEIKAASTTIDILKKELYHKESVITQNQGFDVIFSDITTLKMDIDSLAKIMTLLGSVNNANNCSETINKSLRMVYGQLDAIPFKRISLKMEQLAKNSELIKHAVKLLNSIELVVENQHMLQKKLKTIYIRQEELKNIIIKYGRKINTIALMQEAVTEMIKTHDNFRSIKVSFQKKKMQLSALSGLIMTNSQQKAFQKQIEKMNIVTDQLTQYRQYITEINAVANRLKTVQDTFQNNTRCLNECDKELSSLKNALGVCPFCGSVFRTITDTVIEL